jgi:hypothetical protein
MSNVVEMQVPPENSMYRQGKTPALGRLSTLEKLNIAGKSRHEECEIAGNFR